MERIQKHQLTAKNGRSDVIIYHDTEFDCLAVVYENLDTNQRRCECLLDNNHFDKLASYKSIHALVKYALANQITANSNVNNANSEQETLTTAVSPCPAPAVPAKSTAGSQGIFLPSNEFNNCYLSFELGDDDLEVSVICHSDNGVICITWHDADLFDLENTNDGHLDFANDPNDADINTLDLFYTDKNLFALLACRSPARLLVIAQSLAKSEMFT